MPFEVDVDDTTNLKESIMRILNSTQIRMTGNGNVMYDFLKVICPVNTILIHI
jgi:hypothetical protein